MRACQGNVESSASTTSTWLSFCLVLPRSAHCTWLAARHTALSSKSSARKGRGAVWGSRVACRCTEVWRGLPFLFRDDAGSCGASRAVLRGRKTRSRRLSRGSRWKKARLGWGHTTAVLRAESQGTSRAKVSYVKCALHGPRRQALVSVCFGKKGTGLPKHKMTGRTRLAGRREVTRCRWVSYTFSRRKAVRLCRVRHGAV